MSHFLWFTVYLVLQSTGHKRMMTNDHASKGKDDGDHISEGNASDKTGRKCHNKIC